MFFFSSYRPSSSSSFSNELANLDSDFNIQEYLDKTGMTFQLRKSQWRNAEHLLQQMFEDELDEKDLGIEFNDDFDDLEPITIHAIDTTVNRETLHNLDLL